MAKPFSIQSPEDIAKEYGGNKQKIGEAMQMGIVDPTAGVLAGMFIDRMRAAQMQEMAPQQTVAQQVMGTPAPAQVPPAPQPGAPAGLGAIAPQGEAPMPAPEMAPPQEAPMGMAMGGIAGLDVPDDMFDEPDDGGYAGGGIVAFAGGGMNNLYDRVEYTESRGRQSAVSPKGAQGVMQLMPGTMRDPGFGVPTMAELRKRGLSEEEANRTAGRRYLDAMIRRYGDTQTALMAYNWGPGNVDKWIKAGRPADRVPSETRNYVKSILGGEAEAEGGVGPLREQNMQTAEGRRRSFKDQLAVADEAMATLPDSGLGALEEYYKKEMSPEEREKTRKEDMWMALTQIGASMASTNSPNFLQAAGEAIASALPSVAASKKERRQAERDANRGLAEVLGLKRAERKEVLDFAKDLHRTEMQAEEGQTERAFRSSEAQKTREFTAGENEKERLARLEEAGAKEKGFDALVTANYDKLKAEAEAGSWKTPMGNKPSEEIIRYWAYQHAIEQWAKRSGGQATTGGWPGQNGAGAAAQGPWSQYQ